MSSFDCNGVVVHQAGGTFHLSDKRMKRAVGVLWGAETAQARVRLAREKLHDRGRESRFPDTGIAGKQQHLAFAVLCSCPAPLQHLEFFFPSDQGGETGGMQCLETAFHGTRLQHRPGPHRPGNALELPHPKVLELEEAAEKLSRAFGDDDHVRLGKALQARREVWRLADHAALLRLTR